MTDIPVLLCTGKINSPAPSALSFNPKAFGIEGPVMSASKTAVLKPSLFIITESMEVTIDLPTPPFPLTTPITFLTLDISFNFALMSCMRSSQVSPHEEQLCSQFSLIIKNLLFGIAIYYINYYTTKTERLKMTYVENIFIYIFIFR